MLIDARTLAPGSEILADLCIIGSGPAGTSLAREFRGSTTTVVVLESGGITAEPEAQQLAVPAQLSYGNVQALGCNRQLGGNSSIWSVRTGETWFGVRLMPLAEADFERRDHVTESGWPIHRCDLDPFYARAQAVFKLGPYAYEGEDWADDATPSLPLHAERVRTRMYQFSDGNLFSDTYRRELEQAANITTYYFATATELETSENSAQVNSVQVRTVPGGPTFRIRARKVVLAGGGMASTQLLLNSDVRHPGGIGNQGDRLGRYLMDHPLLIGGELLPASPQLFGRTALYDMRHDGGAHVMAHLQIADELLEHEPLLGLSLMLFPREHNYLAHRELSERQQLGVTAFYNLRQVVAHGSKLKRETLRDLVRGADGIVKRSLDEIIFPKARLNVGGWSRLPFKTRRYHSYEVIHQVEQAPHSDNHVSLNSERDALGMRRLVVDWRWHAEDQAATMRAQELYAEEFRRAGLGEFKIARENGGPKVLLHSTAHYMGMTRMHTDPQQGVVDADCKVHGVDNLSVVSSSVFPTGGFANPTLTIVALALRTADRLKAELAQCATPQLLRLAA